MNWLIAAIGKPSLRFAKLGIEEYEKRIGRYASLRFVTRSKDEGPEKNSRYLLDSTEGSVRIALDERGEPWSTDGFVRQVETWQMDGLRNVAFLVGGADGHAPMLREDCDHVVALSSFTLQHELALVVLLEQLYRAHTILRGEPYHR
jgi:23S rRNA (pseudouridine1915-N3)-methyltransferase